MDDVRRHIDALDDVLVPLLVTRGGYMEAARIKQHDSQVRDESASRPSWRACVRVLKRGRPARRDRSHLPQHDGGLHRLRTPRICPSARAQNLKK